MKPVAYIETSVISYLVAHPSRDLIVAARQQMTRDWWTRMGGAYQLLVSPLVTREARRGDSVAAERRLAVLKDVRSVLVSEEAGALARRLIVDGAVPVGSPEDALHIALASVHGADVLLTWNFKHIANPFTGHAIWASVARAGLNPPLICTPEQMLEEGL
ncbi:MAG: type II toxin-antitoxin system VapC family toxin [Myxococcota bacterium]